jgi:hypothetical protein
MAKRPIIQTIFKEEENIEALQEWANAFLREHEAVNLQVCKNESNLLQMMIVYKIEIEVEADGSNNPSGAGAKEGEQVQGECGEGKAECTGQA